MATSYRSRWNAGFLVALAVSACTASGGPGGVSTTERVAAVREAREVLGAPAAALATEVAASYAAVQQLRVEPPADPSRRLAAVAEIRSEQLARLTSALAAVEGLGIGGDTPDVAAAEAAFASAVEAARDVRAAALEDLATIELAARLDGELATVVSGWDGTGSRRQQMEAFAGLIDSAAAVADRAADVEEVAPCLTTFARRAEAARLVEARSEELRELVVGYRGNEFDEVRDGHRQDPFGDGQLPADADAREADCWRDEATLPTEREAFETAIAALESALNPEDLAG